MALYRAQPFSYCGRLCKPYDCLITAYMRSFPPRAPGDVLGVFHQTGNLNKTEILISLFCIEYAKLKCLCNYTFFDRNSLLKTLLGKISEFICIARHRQCQSKSHISLYQRQGKKIS